MSKHLRASPLLFKQYPILRKKWSGRLQPLGPYRSPFGSSTVVRNEAGETMAMQDRYLVQVDDNPRIPQTKFASRADHHAELLSQLNDWLFLHVEKPGPLLMAFFKRAGVQNALRDLKNTPQDREYLVVEFDLLPCFLEEARTTSGRMRLTNRVTTEIVPFLGGDSADWWLGYQLPMLQEKGVVSPGQVRSAQAAWARMLRDMQ